MTKTAAFSRILLPVDALQSYRRVLPFVGVLYRTMKLRPEQVHLLHVIEGSFLQRHMDTSDISAGEVPTAADMKRLRSQYMKDRVEPMLRQAAEMLGEVTDQRERPVFFQDGDPVGIIDEICRHGGYSTLIMSRRGNDEGAAKLTGSVVSGILHRHSDATIFLVGDQELQPGVSPFARCLIGIDGSPESRSAVAEAGILLARVDAEIEKVLLLHVLDQSCYYDENGVSCIQASISGQRALEEAGNMLTAAGVRQEKITTVIHFGKPGTVLAEEAIDCDATLVFIGKRDRSRMAQVFLGSVCTDMIENCRKKTIVLCN
ncbi:MAG: hypothetical protein CR981_04300 [Proteobacteria bacterium]|nr:MAG: hypothetical protein CR981_04300 [Pseudomonadota bacterium]